VHQFLDNISWNRGNHSFKIGADARWNRSGRVQRRGFGFFLIGFGTLFTCTAWRRNAVPTNRLISSVVWFVVGT
jgi:hypothetical protein